MTLKIISLQKPLEFSCFPSEILDKEILNYLNLKDIRNFFHAVPSIRSRYKLKLVKLLFCLKAKVVSAALKAAVKAQKIAIIGKVIQIPQIEEDRLEWALMYSTEKNHIEIVKKIIPRIVSLDDNSLGTAFIRAATEGYIEIAKAMIDYKEIDGIVLGIALKCSILQNRLEIVDTIIANRKFSNINKENRNLALTYSKQKHTEKFKARMTILACFVVAVAFLALNQIYYRGNSHSFFPTQR